ncbi:MAG TPA: hypothetical protein H9987_10355 [Candidatus Luteococcus avicola]|nr:hypothetical protein [Candidatus Luteococcus avicola]
MGKKFIRFGLAAAVTAASLTGGYLSASPARAATQSSMTCTDGADPTHYACSVRGTTDQKSVTLPVSASAGVDLPVGTYPMATGAGTMTLTNDQMTFTFSDAYFASHTAPFTFSGEFSFVVRSYDVAGPFSVTVNGTTFSTPGPGGFCDADCQAAQVHGTFKAAWDTGSGRVGFALVSGVETVVGQPVTFTDVAGPGQSDCEATLAQQHPAGWWKNLVTATGTGTTLSATYTPTEPGALRMAGSCAVDGSQQVYADFGTINGVAVTAKTAVTSASADGQGGTPVPPPTRPTTPPSVKMVTETYQVDVATLRSKVVLNKYLAADDDRRLVYRELGPLWQQARHAKHFSEKHEYVTITVPVGATRAQRIAAINAKTRLGDVKTTSTAGPSTRSRATVVYAWKLDTAHGAKPVDGGAAWGPKRNLPQVFVARG